MRATERPGEERLRSASARERPASPDEPLVAAGPSVPRFRRAAAIGAIAGLLATLVMSLVMLPARWLGLLGTQPPRRIVDRALAAGGARGTSEGGRRAGTAIVHLGSGAAFGAAYGIGRAASGSRGSGAGIGAAFGSAVWALNYVVAAPALELLPPPWKDRPARPWVMAAAHVVFGVMTALLFDGTFGSASGRTPRA